MGRKRSKLKVCGRLGVNAYMRTWFGKKKKWEERKRFWKEPKQDNSEEVQRVNPGYKGERQRRLTGGRKRGSNRRKDETASILELKKGRERRYGGVDLKERREYKQERRKERTQRYRKLSRQNRKGRPRNLKGEEKKREDWRRGGNERRVDVRRWRAGRVDSVQAGRNRIEKGKVRRRNEEGKEVGRVEHRGKTLKPKQGRKREEAVWKQRKKEREKKIQTPEMGKYGCGHREVDYLTGIRRVHRRPRSGDLIYPKGRERNRDR
jgi:hypothetical protein